MRKKTAGLPDEPIIIKKYANRRLYNTARSSYVTLEDLSQMVRKGEDFAVFDAKTGEDITRSVLTQIIFEAESRGQNMLPINFLRQLIRLYGDALQGAVPGYLDATMERLAVEREKVLDVYRKNPAFANYEAMTRQNMEFFRQAMHMFSPFKPPVEGAPGAMPGAVPEAGAEGQPTPVAPQGAADGGEPDRTSDLDAMRAQLDAMQKQIEKLGKP